MRTWGKQVKVPQVPGEEMFADSVRDGLSVVEFRAPTRRGETVPETDWLSDPDNRTFVASLAQRHGIELAYHAPQGEEWCFGKLSPDVSVEKLRHCILRASSLNAACMTIHLGIDVNLPREVSIRRAARALNDAAPLAVREGVVLCVENVFDRSSLQYPDEGKLLFQIVDSDQIRFTLDTGHAHMYDCLHEMLDIVNGRLAFTHIHDNDGENDQHLVPGHGSIDWDRFMSHLDESGYEGPLCLELREECSFPDVIRRF